MSYLEFERGISSKQIRHLREQAETQELRHEMTRRWKESERILAILRSVSSAPTETSGIEDWFQKVKLVPSIPHEFDERLLRTPSGWFASKFPNQTLLFGSAFFEDNASSIQGATLIRPSVINEDFFAAMLSGERHLGHQMIYLPGDGFWFKDPKLDAFCPTSDKKVEILLSNYLVKCAENMQGNVDSKMLVRDHRRQPSLCAVSKTRFRVTSGIRG